MKPGDDLDGLLRAFFRAQLPKPWPAPRVPRFRSAPLERPSSGRSRNRSRWALAASIGLLLLGSLFLSGRFTQSVKPADTLDAPAISSHDLPRRMEKEHKLKEHENKNKTGLGVDDGHLHGLDEFDLSPIK